MIVYGFLTLRFGISQTDFAKLCIISSEPGKFQVEFNLYRHDDSLGSVKVYDGTYLVTYLQKTLSTLPNFITLSLIADPFTNNLTAVWACVDFSHFQTYITDVMPSFQLVTETSLWDEMWYVVRYFLAKILQVV